ncbi:MAG TPA: hypothetical protein VFG13_01300 [Blastococcus sp.]|nr:hypothetical protein [Blastococcus sp.]
MATVRVTPTTVTVSFTRAEKFWGLVRDLEVDRAAVRGVEVVEEALSAARGLRAPGLAWPGRRKIGTWRCRGEKSLVSVRRGQPAVRIRLEGARYDTVLVGADDAATLAGTLA